MGAVGLSVVGIASAGGAGHGPGAAEAELIPAFGDAQAPGDQLPRDVAEVAGAVPETARLLGTARGVTFWAATTAGGDICLVAELPNGVNASPGDDPVTGTACTSASLFAARGAAISVDGHTAAHGIVAYLLPAGADGADVRTAAASLDSDVVVERGATLIAADPADAGRAGGIEIGIAEGGSLSLPTLDTCGHVCD
ncbi:hypothetical protein GCG21_13020 [Pseudactinotalea sp. HY160]|uniref:hypothetical protein n=1 Tax=Pseudactinotalea sp. HY160 TaxID=2654490 RepID=UPI00128DB107|nr:hypothetical protein [Pseudactinotalea sp. HY160]MPV50912.1 hypothetical protein [Pseudactinotalea sp. HY160]